MPPPKIGNTSCPREVLATPAVIWRPLSFEAFAQPGEQVLADRAIWRPPGMRENTNRGEPVLAAPVKAAIWRPPGMEEGTKSGPAVLATTTNKAKERKRAKRPGYKRFTDEQLNVLQREFGRNKYITLPKRIELSMQCKLTERQIRVWFSNRRRNAIKRLDRHLGLGQHYNRSTEAGVHSQAAPPPLKTM